MELRTRTPAEPAAPAAPLASIAVLVGLLLLQAAVGGADRTEVDLPPSAVREEADRGAACVVLARGAGAATAFAFTDGEGPSRPLGGVTDVFLAALRVVSEDPDRPFSIKADGGVRHGLVDEVIEQLRKAGVRRLTLLTSPRRTEDAP